MNSNYLRYIWAFYRQRPLSGWVLRNIMCLYRLLLFPLCILITLAFFFFSPNSYEQNFNYTYSWVCNAHPCFCEPCVWALRRRLGASERQAGGCAGGATGTRCCSWIREGAAASSGTFSKGFTARWGSWLQDDMLCAASSLPCRSAWGWPQAAEQGGLHLMPLVGPRAWMPVGGWLWCWGAAVLCRSFGTQGEQLTEFSESQKLGQISPVRFSFLFCEKTV